MIGAGPQLQFIKAQDAVLDQAPVYGFTIPVFGKGIVYDSPLDERQQQVKLLVHSMNTKGLEAMVPKMIDEAEDTLEEVLEPHLIRCGLLARTPRGRVATSAAYQHIGLPVPKVDPAGPGELPFA